MSAERAKVLQQQHQSQETTQQQHNVQVHKKRWISTGEKVLYSLFSGLAILLCIVVVSYSSTLDTVNRDTQKLEKQIKAQQLQNENLQYKVKELSNPERILSIAKENGLKIHQSKVKQADSVSGS